MKLIIDIPNYIVEALKDSNICYEKYKIFEAIKNSTPLEEHCNNCEIGNPCLYCKHSFEERGERDEASD